MKRYVWCGHGLVLLLVILAAPCVGVSATPAPKTALPAQPRAVAPYGKTPSLDNRTPLRHEPPPGKYADPYDRRIPYQGKTHEGYIYGKKKGYKLRY